MANVSGSLTFKPFEMFSNYRNRKLWDKTRRELGTDDPFYWGQQGQASQEPVDDLKILESKHVQKVSEKLEKAAGERPMPNWQDMEKAWQELYIEFLAQGGDAEFLDRMITPYRQAHLTAEKKTWEMVDRLKDDPSLVFGFKPKWSVDWTGIPGTGLPGGPPRGFSPRQTVTSLMNLPEWKGEGGAPGQDIRETQWQAMPDDYVGQVEDIAPYVAPDIVTPADQPADKATLLRHLRQYRDLAQPKIDMDTVEADIAAIEGETALPVDQRNALALKYPGLEFDESGAIKGTVAPKTRTAAGKETAAETYWSTQVADWREKFTALHDVSSDDSAAYYDEEGKLKKWDELLPEEQGVLQQTARHLKSALTQRFGAEGAGPMFEHEIMQSPYAQDLGAAGGRKPPPDPITPEAQRKLDDASAQALKNRVVVPPPTPTTTSSALGQWLGGDPNAAVQRQPVTLAPADAAGGKLLEEGGSVLGRTVAKTVAPWRLGENVAKTSRELGELRRNVMGYKPSPETKGRARKYFTPPVPGKAKVPPPEAPETPQDIDVTQEYLAATEGMPAADQIKWLERRLTDKSLPPAQQKALREFLAAAKQSAGPQSIGDVKNAAVKSRVQKLMESWGLSFEAAYRRAREQQGQ